VLAPTVMAARRRPRWRRRRRRRFSAMAILVAVGRLQDRVTLWRPVAWLNIRQAFKPLAKQRLYSAKKSAVETAGCGVGRAGAGCVVGQAGPPAPAHTSPLTTLAHLAVGETREVGGRGGPYNGWHPAGLAGSPATPEEGEAGRAWQVDRHPADLLHPPSPAGGGETGSGAGIRVQEWSSLPDEG
jgi:hypothetical protein